MTETPHCACAIRKIHNAREAWDTLLRLLTNTLLSGGLRSFLIIRIIGYAHRRTCQARARLVHHWVNPNGFPYTGREATRLT